MNKSVYIMDMCMKSYFSKIFNKLYRYRLQNKSKRHDLVELIKIIIAGYAKGECSDENSACRCFTRAVLDYHEECKARNGQVCPMSKHHQILYIALKLSFDFRLQDNGTVARLLDNIYSCEKTFGRIFWGAFSETSHGMLGLKSDFADQEENINAVVYFLEHATNANLEYTCGETVHRFIDVPLDSVRFLCNPHSPVSVAILLFASNMLMTLLRFGTKVQVDEYSTRSIKRILDRLLECKRKYPDESVTCLKLILRVVPTINLNFDNARINFADYPLDYNIQRKVILEKYGDIIEDHLIPASRCGLEPVELKHLCRCIVRERLWLNFQLPFGISKLPVPMSMQKYLDICED